MPLNMPDRDYVLHFCQQAQTFCAEWHDKIVHWRKLYDFQHFPSRPKPGEVQFADPTYTNTVDLAVGVLMANQLSWNAFGFAPGVSEQVGASRVEKYLAGLLDVASEREEYLVPYEVILNFVRDGCGVVYCVWDGVLADRFRTTLPVPDDDGNLAPRTVYTEPPLRVQVIDPLKVFALPGGTGRWSRVCRVESMTVYDVEALYGVRASRYSHLSPMDKMLVKDKLVDFWEIADRPAKETLPEGVEIPEEDMAWYGLQPYAFRNAVLFGDDLILPLRYMPGYSDLPYTLGFFKPVDRDKPQDWGHSIIQPLETSLEHLERAFNRRGRQIDVYSSLPIVSRTIAGRSVSVDPGLASHVQLSTEEDIGFPTWPGNAPDVQLQIDFLRARVQQSGFSDVMYGSGASAASGYALSQLGDQNRIRLTQPVVHLEMLFTHWATKALRLTQHFAPDALVRVYGRMKGRDFAEQVSGEDVAGYKVKAQVRPQFPNEEVRKHAMATQVKGILAERTIMEKYLGVEQPDDERKKRMQEQALAHPVMMTYTLVAALQEMAQEGDEAAGLALQTLQRTGGANQPGRPEEPRAPEQPVGLQSATGQPTPQAQGEAPPGQSFEEAIQRQALATPEMVSGEVEGG